jgi:hypothetical protein
MQGEPIRTVDAVQFLREAWNQLETKVIPVGWEIYEDALGLLEELIGDGKWKEELDD